MESLAMLLAAAVIGMGLGFGLMLGIGVFKALDDVLKRLINNLGKGK
ncbi:hypothetical protein ACTXGO_00950 [Psychrobacter sp. T6-1]